MEGAYPATALGKLTSGLPTSSLSQPQICFERRSTIRYLYVPESALRNSNHITDGTAIDTLESKLTEATGREVAVQDGSEYVLLKVTYDGEVLEADRKFGDECSYSTLYRVEPW